MSHDFFFLSFLILRQFYFFTYFIQTIQEVEEDEEDESAEEWVELMKGSGRGSAKGTR